MVFGPSGDHMFLAIRALWDHMFLAIQPLRDHMFVAIRSVQDQMFLAIRSPRDQMFLALSHSEPMLFAIWSLRPSRAWGMTRVQGPKLTSVGFRFGHTWRFMVLITQF